MRLLRNWKFWILAIPGLFLALIILIVLVAEPVEDTPPPVIAVADVTPTAAESLQEFTLCTRLKANKSVTWGQSSGVIYSGDPRVTGQIEAGDYVRVLTSKPNADGNIRVEVFPHDDRAVGLDGKVWISWSMLTQNRLDRDLFACEG